MFVPTPLISFSSRVTETRKQVFFNSFAIYWVTTGVYSTTRLPTTTSLGGGTSKPPASERHFAGDCKCSVHGKPKVTSPSASDPSDSSHDRTGPGSGVPDAFATYLQKRDSVLGIGLGKITFAPLDAVAENEDEHKNKDFDLNLADVSLNPQRQEPPPSRLKALISMVTNPFRTTKHSAADDACSSIQVCGDILVDSFLFSIPSVLPSLILIIFLFKDHGHDRVRDGRTIGRRGTIFSATRPSQYPCGWPWPSRKPDRKCGCRWGGGWASDLSVGDWRRFVLKTFF